MDTDGCLFLVPGSRPARDVAQADQRQLHVPTLNSQHSHTSLCCRALCNTDVEPVLHSQRPELRKKEHIAVVYPSSVPPRDPPGLCLAPGKYKTQRQN